VIADTKINDLSVQVIICHELRISKLLTQRPILSIGIGSEKRRAVKAILVVVVAIALVVHPYHQSDHRQVCHQPPY